MNFNWQQTDKRKESGNIILTLFAAVAVIGTIGGSAAVLMRGPLSTMSDVNQNTMTEGSIYTAAKMVLLDAENWTAAGDCDNDRVVEPRPWRTHADTPPTGGGFIPNEIGSVKRDPWGTQLGYCAWDHGSVVTDNETVTDDKGCDAYNLLEGTNKRNYPTVAVISAGPNGTFDSTCRDWTASDLDDDGGGMSPDGDLNDTGDLQLFSPGGDDIYVVYSYAEAAQELPSLWKVDSPDIWSIEVDGASPEVVAKDKVEFTGSDVFAPTRIEMVGQLGLKIPDELALPNCTATTNGQIRRNMSGASPILELCDFAAGDFQEISGLATGSAPSEEEAGAGGIAGNDGFGGGTGAGSNTDLSIAGPIQGLVGYWRLDETGGTTAYEGINGFNGTMQGSMDASNDSVAGLLNNAMDFDGSDDYLRVTHTPDLANFTGLTLSAWINPQGPVSASWEHIISKDNGTGANYGIIWAGTTSVGEGCMSVGVIEFRIQDTGFTSHHLCSSSVISENTGWHHVTATWDGSTARMYINGDYETSKAVAITHGDSGDDLGIGANVDDPTGRAFEGYIDDVRIYDRPLSDLEVQELYNRTNYIAQATVAQTGAAGSTIDSAGWATLLASDALGDTAGIAFKLADTYSLTDAPSAAILAYREAAPSRANLVFQTNDGTGLTTGMINTVDQDGLVLDDNPSVTQEANIQIGEHFDPAWNNNYVPGLLVTGNNELLNQLAYFGDSALDDASTMLLFSKMLKLQQSNASGASISEYLRFESTPQITAFSNVENAYDATSAGYRIERYSGTAGDVSNFDFIRNRGGSSAVANSDVIGAFLFSNPVNSAGPTAAIQGIVNGAVSAGDVPVDLVFSTGATGNALSQEGLRITSAGDVGVGKPAPEAKFHVGGRLVSDEGIKIGPDSNCSEITDTGTLAYNGGSYELCDGSAFNVIGGAGVSGGIVSNNDCKPIAFDFYDRDDLSVSTTYETNTVMIGGWVEDCTLTVHSDSASMVIVKNGTSQSGSAVNVSSGDTISIRMQSSGDGAGYVTAQVHLGNHHDEVNFQTAGKIAFVSSFTMTGDLGGVDGADNICQALADASNLNLRGTYMAWITGDDANRAPRYRFSQYDGEYYLPNGTKIADNWADLLDGTLAAKMRVNQVGVDVGTGYAWTNTNNGGYKASTNHCSEWSIGNGSDIGRRGNIDSTTLWTNDSTNTGCGASYRIYCFEQ